jgi:protein SCO1/2
MNRRGKLAVVAGATVLLAVVVMAVAERWAARPTDRQGEGGLEELGDYGEVPAFTLAERSGRPVTHEDLKGVVWVADFIDTECTETCPVQSLQFARLEQEFGDAADLRLVSIMVDPEHDTTEILRRYAARYGAGQR